MSHPLPCLPTRPSSPAAPHHSLPQRVCGDGHNTLWALLRCETRCKLQSLIGQGSQVETGLIGVTEPGTAWHGQHLGRTQHSTARLNSVQHEWMHTNKRRSNPIPSPLHKGNSWGWTLPSSQHTFTNTACFQGKIPPRNCVQRGTLKHNQDSGHKLRYSKNYLIC